MALLAIGAWSYRPGTDRGQGRRSDQGRHVHGAHRRRGADRQAGAARAANLARRRQRQGRCAGASGRARLLRRPEQSRERPAALHEADRRRQGRPRDRAVRDQYGRAGHPGRDAAQDDHHRHLRHRREQQIPLRPLFLDAADGPEPQKSFAYGFFELAAAQRRSRRRWRSSAPTPSSARTPPTARGKAKESPASSSSSTRTIRRPRPTSRRSCARCRRAIPTSSTSQPIRRTPSASCAPRRSRLSPKMLGGTFIGLLVTPIKVQLGPLMNGIVNNEVFLPAPV